MLVGFLIFLDVVVCFLLIGVILMQSGKGGVSAAFGIGGASQTLFGAGQAGNVLTKATWVLGSGFLALSLLIAMLGGPNAANRSRQSILQPAARTTAPAPASSSGSSLPGSVPPQTNPPATGAPAGQAPGTPVPATTPTGGR